MVLVAGLVVAAGSLAAVVVRVGGEGDAPLSAAADICHGRFATMGGVRITDDGHTMTIDGQGDETIRQASMVANVEQIACILNELGTPHAVVAKMEGTRALDGMQAAEWGDFSASWTYHPDDGLDLIITAS